MRTLLLRGLLLQRYLQERGGLCDEIFILCIISGGILETVENKFNSRKMQQCGIRTILDRNSQTIANTGFYNFG